jgi:hypothetical protein
LSKTSAASCSLRTIAPAPRPPAWICALTTTTFVPSSSAAFFASSALVTMRPRGTATP